MAALHKEYGDKVRFLLVYVREAHPSDGWAVPGWSTLEDADDEKGRGENAGTCSSELKFEFPVALDTIDDATAVRWSAWPERLFVVSKEGRVVYTGDQGPWGFNPGGDYKGFEGKSVGVSLGDFLAAYLKP